MSLKDAARLFIRGDVQAILRSFTKPELYAEKVLSSKFNTKLKKTRLELLTDEDLNKKREYSIRKASYLLQMPPFLAPREPCDHLIAEDKDLNKFSDSGHIFIDISLNIPKTNRLIVVREPDGRLRHANWNERERMLQIFYPAEGKLFHTPVMFNPDALEVILNEKRYKLILDKACIQFEPDDAEFIRITHRTYEFVNEQKDFESLKGTRFYGPMVFYLTYYKKLNNLFVFSLRNNDIYECEGLIRLHSLVHANDSAQKWSDNVIDMIAAFIKNELKDNAEAELVFNQYQSTLGIASLSNDQSVLST